MSYTLRTHAGKVACAWCGKKFWACRRDSKWCSEQCRYRNRQENAKFARSKIPRSGLAGITFNRFRERWEVRIKEGMRWKYVGAFGTLEASVAFQREVLGAVNG